MSTLIIDRSDLEARLDGSALALYENGVRTGTVPINLLERVVLQGNVKLETALLTRLAEDGVTTILLSKRHSRRTATVLGAGHSDAGIRLAQCRLAFDEAWCNGWARRLIDRKLAGQAKMLRVALQARPDCRKALTDSVARVENTIRRLHSEPAPDAASVRGIEGAAAAAYFQGLGAVFAPALQFSGRNRRPPRDPVNACLSLGYTLLHFDAVRAAHSAGLDVMVGFFHRPAYGRESLACDLVEPLRPRVDAWVWGLFRERVLREDHFARDKGACLLHKTGRERFYQAYEQFARAPRRLLRRECQVLAKALHSRGEPLMERVTADEEF